MPDPRLRLYGALARGPLARSYRGKFLALICVTIQLPLLAVLVYALIATPGGLLGAWPLLLVALLVTLLGLAAMLIALDGLLAPIGLAAAGLRAYHRDRSVPDLPLTFPDRAGQLLADVQAAVEGLDEALALLAHTAATDSLTGVANRRAAEAYLAIDLARAHRGDAPLALALIDLDDFKQINERYGHATGDAALQHAVRQIAAGLRAGDWLARWGGDEFLIGLWDSAAALDVLQRVQTSLAHTPFIAPGGTRLALTLSIGLTQVAGLDGPTLVGQADAALREAKRAGKARVRIYARPPAMSPLGTRPATGAPLPEPALSHGDGEGYRTAG